MTKKKNFLSEVLERHIPCHVNEHSEVVFTDPADFMLHFVIIDEQIIHVDVEDMTGQSDEFDEKILDDDFDNENQMDLFEILSSNEFHGEYGENDE